MVLYMKQRFGNPSAVYNLVFKNLNYVHLLNKNLKHWRNARSTELSEL